MELKEDMSEKELIDRFLRIKQDFHHLDIKKAFTKDEENLFKINQRELELISEKDEVEKSLIEIENKETSREIYQLVISRFIEMTNLVDKAFGSYPISRNQGMILDNYFAAKILEEIKKPIYCNFYGISRPFLNLTSDPEDSLERKELIVFFQDEVNILNEIHPINYIKLYNYFSDFTSRLLDKFVK